MAKTYRPYVPEQDLLLPPSLRDWLPEDHLAYFVLDLLSDMDLGSIERSLQAKDARGERPFAPRMMLALLVYGYAVGVFSSRKMFPGLMSRCTIPFSCAARSPVAIWRLIRRMSPMGSGPIFRI